MKVSVDQIKEEVSKLISYKPLSETSFYFLCTKKARLQYFLKFIQSEKLLKSTFSKDEILELNFHLAKTEQDIKDHYLLTSQSLPEAYSSNELQKQLKQGVKDYKKSMNEFIRKNKRSKIGRLRLKFLFS